MHTDGCFILRKRDERKHKRKHLEVFARKRKVLRCKVFRHKHMTNSKDTERSTGSRLLGMSWTHFLNDGSANYLPGILPAILIALHEPVSMAGAIMAALLIGQALQPFMGQIADRLGGNSLIAIGLSGSAIGGGLLGFAHELPVLIGLLLLIGIGNSTFHPQALAAVRSLVQKRQGLSLSLFLIGGELGRGVWPVVVSFIVVHFGLPALWITALPAIITIPFIAKIAPKLPRRVSAGAHIEWRKHLQPFIGLVGFAGTRAFITYGLVTFIPLLWHLHGGALISGASIITTLIGVGVIGNLTGGHLADRLGRRPVIVISSILVILFVPLMLYAAGVWIWVIAAIIGMSIFSSSPVSVLIGQDIFPENRSMGSGIALGLGNGIGAMLVFLVGFWITDQTIAQVFWVMAVAGVISALLSLIIPQRYMVQTAE